MLVLLLEQLNAEIDQGTHLDYEELGKKEMIILSLHQFAKLLHSLAMQPAVWAGLEVNIGSSSSLSWRFCQRNAHLTIPVRVF